MPDRGGLGRQVLIARGMALRQALLWPGAAGLAFVLAAGLAAVATTLTRLAHPRPLASAGAWLGGLLLVTLPLGYGRQQAGALEAGTVEALAATLMEGVEGLPRPVPSGSAEPIGIDLPPWQLAAVLGARGWVQGPGGTLAGEPLGEPVVTDPGEGPVLVVAPAGTRASEVATRRWAAVVGVPAPVELAVFVDGGSEALDEALPGARALRAGAVEFLWLPAEVWMPAPGDARDSPGESARDWAADDPAWQAVLFVEGQGTGFALHTVAGSVEDVLDLPSGLAGLPRPDDPDGYDLAVLVPEPGWSLQDLVGHCLAVRGALGSGGEVRATPVSCGLTAALPAAALSVARAQQPPRVLLDDPDRLFRGDLAGGAGPGEPTFGVGRLGDAREGVVGVLGDQVVILGNLDREVINAVVRRQLASIRYCYQRQLTTNPALEGRIVVKFVVAKDGTVASSQVKSSTLGDAQVEACVAGRLEHFRFPEPKGGGIVIVSYPLWFSAE